MQRMCLGIAFTMRTLLPGVGVNPSTECTGNSQVHVDSIDKFWFLNQNYHRGSQLSVKSSVAAV